MAIRPGCSWGLGRHFLAAPMGPHVSGLGASRSCQEAVCQEGAQMPSTGSSAPDLLGPVGGQPACLRAGEQHLPCPLSSVHRP